MNELEREVMRRALDALENVRVEYDYHGEPFHDEHKAMFLVIDALRAALVADQQAGPVAWNFQSFESWWDSHGFHNASAAGQIDGKPLAKLAWEVAREIAAVQSGPVQVETVLVQQAWEWAGGNPGIRATAEDLRVQLEMLDRVWDEASQQAEPTHRSAMQKLAEPAGWLRSPDGHFKRNLMYQIGFPAQNVAWQVPVYFHPLAEPVALTVAEIEQMNAQWSYEIHGDRTRYLVRMTEKAHGIKGAV